MSKKVNKICPLCKKETSMELKEEEYERYIEDNSQTHIQVLFPHMSPAKREFLAFGMCLPCQGEIFN